MSLSIPNRSRTLIILSGASSTVVSRLSGWVFGISVIAGLHTVRAGLVEALFWSLSANMKNRSEEHTSELQSLMRISYAVFCLKKKNKRKYNDTTNENKT